MPDLNSLLVFAAVAEAKSFSQAARRLGMPVSTVSRRVAELEDQLGVRLLERSTRSLRLTDVGAEVLDYAQQTAEVSDAVDSLVSNRVSEVTGTLRVSCPPSIADSLMAPLIASFQASYPAVRVHVMVADRMVDLISEGIDLALRVGPLKDSSLMARKILRYRHQLVASPGYLAQHKEPRRPQDLAKHRLLAFSFLADRSKWVFVKKSEQESVTFEPFLAMNDFAGLATALKGGCGIGDLPPIVAPHLLENGELVEVMPQWRFRPVDLSVVHLQNRQLPRPVRLFKEFTARFAPTLFPDLPS